MVAASKQCLDRYWKEHNEFFHSNCIQTEEGRKQCLSKFFGDRKYSKDKNGVRSDGKKLRYLGDELEEIGFSSDYMYKMKNISCVGMTLNCVGEGLKATGQGELWSKIRYHVVKENSASGMALQNALNKLGWTAHYWNPATHEEMNVTAKEWDAEEENFGASKGHHWWRYRKVMRSGLYWFNPVDDTTALVGFGHSTPDILYRMPFWVGTAHTGYHVFPGSYQKVIEAHSTRRLTSIHNLEYGPFNPLSGGAPKWTSSEKYRSGLILLPPISSNPYVKH